MGRPQGAPGVVRDADHRRRQCLSGRARGSRGSVESRRHRILHSRARRSAAGRAHHQTGRRPRRDAPRRGGHRSPGRRRLRHRAARARLRGAGRDRTGRSRSRCPRAPHRCRRDTRCISKTSTSSPEISSPTTFAPATSRAGSDPTRREATSSSSRCGRSSRNSRWPRASRCPARATTARSTSSSTRSGRSSSPPGSSIVERRMPAARAPARDIRAVARDGSRSQGARGADGELVPRVDDERSAGAVAWDRIVVRDPDQAGRRRDGGGRQRDGAGRRLAREARDRPGSAAGDAGAQLAPESAGRDQAPAVEPRPVGRCGGQRQSQLRHLDVVRPRAAAAAADQLRDAEERADAGAGRRRYARRDQGAGAPAGRAAQAPAGRGASDAVPGGAHSASSSS